MQDSRIANLNAALNDMLNSMGLTSMVTNVESNVTPTVEDEGLDENNPFGNATSETEEVVEESEVSNDDIATSVEPAPVEPVQSLDIRQFENKETTSRFSGASWAKPIQERNVMIAGLGGIGSYAALLISKLNPGSITIVDPDVVEAGNLSGQLYMMSQVNNSKVSSSIANIKEFANYYTVQGIQDCYSLTSFNDTSDIMICGFDNMKARKYYFQKWREYVDSLPIERQSHCLFIDGRLAMEHLQVFCLTGDNKGRIDKYVKEDLFDTYQAEVTVCSMKQTAFMGNMIGSIITNLLVNFVDNTSNKERVIERNLPYYTEYDSEFMMFKVDNTI